MTFSVALECLKEGRKMARKGWNGRSMWLKLQKPDENSLMTVGYLFMKTADGELVPWAASQTDMLAEDWEFADL